MDRLLTIRAEEKQFISLIRVVEQLLYLVSQVLQQEILLLQLFNFIGLSSDQLFLGLPVFSILSALFPIFSILFPVVLYLNPSLVQLLLLEYIVI